MAHETYLPPERGGPELSSPAPDARDPQALRDLTEQFWDGSLPDDTAVRHEAAHQLETEQRVRTAFEALSDLILRAGSDESITPEAIHTAQQDLLEAQMAKHGSTPSWRQ